MSIHFFWNIHTFSLLSVENSLTDAQAWLNFPISTKSLIVNYVNQKKKGKVDDISLVLRKLNFLILPMASSLLYHLLLFFIFLWLKSRNQSFEESGKILICRITTYWKSSKAFEISAYQKQLFKKMKYYIDDCTWA